MVMWVTSAFLMRLAANARASCGFRSIEAGSSLVRSVLVVQLIVTMIFSFMQGDQSVTTPIQSVVAEWSECGSVGDLGERHVPPVLRKPLLFAGGSTDGEIMSAAEARNIALERLTSER